MSSTPDGAQRTQLSGVPDNEMMEGDMESPKNEGERLPVEGTSDLSARFGAGLDEFHLHEALDRTHVILCMIDDHLLGHPFVTANPEIEAKIMEASKTLCGVYQQIGSMTLSA